MTIPPLILTELVRTPEEPETTLDAARDLGLPPKDAAQTEGSADAPDIPPPQTRTTQSGSE